MACYWTTVRRGGAYCIMNIGLIFWDFLVFLMFLRKFLISLDFVDFFQFLLNLAFFLDFM